MREREREGACARPRERERGCKRALTHARTRERERKRESEVSDVVGDKPLVEILKSQLAAKLTIPHHCKTYCREISAATAATTTLRVRQNFSTISATDILQVILAAD